MSTCLKHGNPTCPLCLGDFWGFPGTQAPDLLWCLLEAPSVSFQDAINSDRSRFWEPGTPINPCLPSQHSPDHFSGPDIPGTSPTLKAPPAPAAPDDFQGLKLTAHFLRVPRLTSLLLHLCTDGEIANCCNHYVRLWSFLKKSISGYFSNEIKSLYAKDICIFPIFIAAYLQQPRNWNNLTVHWGMNG